MAALLGQPEVGYTLLLSLSLLSRTPPSHLSAAPTYPPNHGLPGIEPEQPNALKGRRRGGGRDAAAERRDAAADSRCGRCASPAL